MESNKTNATNVAPVNTVSALLKNTGINIDVTKAKAARRNLNKSGAQSVNLSDEVVVAAANVNNALVNADVSIKQACYIVGAFRIAETWKSSKDDSGKPFKSENAFLKGILPGYAMSTISIYADVGATIYLPAANGVYKDMPELADLSPAGAKILLSSLKDADKRKRLPAALKEAKEANGGKLSQKALTAAVKKLNDVEKSATPGAGPDSQGAIADALKGGSVSSMLQSMVSFTYNGDGNKDGDLTAIVFEKNIKDFISLLAKGADDKEAARSICDTLCKMAKSAK